MSLIFGTFAHVWASILALPVAIVVTTIIFWCYRFSGIQRIVMPGADECRLLERWVAVHSVRGKGEQDISDAALAAIARLGHGLLIRNGMNAIAVAIVFLAVFTGSHALLAAL